MNEHLNDWLKNEGLSHQKNGENSPQKQKKPHTTHRVAPRTNTARPAAKPATKRAPRTFSRHLSSGKVDPRSPHLHRPTAEKRDKYHITNTLKPQNVGDIRVVPLGGMEQVGENMMFLEWGDDIIVIDTGLVFSSGENIGIDFYLPDISYLIKNKHRIRGIFYTHGHLDHVGGVPYILPKLGFPPVYATRMTKEFILAQGEETGISEKVHVQEITLKSHIKLGKFEVEFFHINHSIPDNVGIAVKTPYGYVVNSSDFKIDYNPSDGQPADLGSLAALGKKGVILALIDSTNVMKSGHSISESVIGKSLKKIIHDAEGRVVVATFSSNVGRVTQLIEAAEACGRTVFLSGRSMERNITIARKTNHLRCKDKTIQRMGPAVEKLPENKILILTTGSQGEELAGLTRMANGSHRDVKLRTKDTVIFSSSPIPGNEIAVNKVFNNLVEHGVTHIDNQKMDTHSTGHGHVEECKMFLSLLNPKYFAPIHGELFMRHHHAKVAMEDLQYRPENCFIMRNGRGLIINQKGCHLMTKKEAVTTGDVAIQNQEILTEASIEERKIMGQNGLILAKIYHSGGSIKKIDLHTSGFLYTDRSHKIFSAIKKSIEETWVKNYDPSRTESMLTEPILINIKKTLESFRFRDFPLIEVVV